MLTHAGWDEMRGEESGQKKAFKSMWLYHLCNISSSSSNAYVKGGVAKTQVNSIVHLGAKEVHQTKGGETRKRP